MKPKAILAWSSGKDSAWCLHILRQQQEVEVVALLTSFNEAADRVAMHAVRRELVEAQADAAGLPLRKLNLPWPCSNEQYESRMGILIAEARQQGVTHFAFGDLFLEDIRAYRERQLAGTGITPLFPLWGPPSATSQLAREMLASHLRAVLTCVDPSQLNPQFVGREFNAVLLADLPPDVDPCGERGEFHTFCFAGPMFARTISVHVGEQVVHDGFHFADLLPSPSSRCSMAKVTSSLG